MLHSRYRPVLLALAAALIVVSGCSNRATVEGTVTLDDRPVDGGVITFAPTDGKGKAVSADIVAGHYVLQSAQRPAHGSYRVEIYWKKKTGRQVEVPGDPGHRMDQVVQLIPPQYNTQSTQLAKVKSRSHTFNFALKSH
jgi:hypothetical protein